MSSRARSCSSSVGIGPLHRPVQVARPYAASLRLQMARPSCGLTYFRTRHQRPPRDLADHHEVTKATTPVDVLTVVGGSRILVGLLPQPTRSGQIQVMQLFARS